MGEACSYDSIPLEATDAPEDGETTFDEAFDSVGGGEPIFDEALDSVGGGVRTGRIFVVAEVVCSKLGVTCSLFCNADHLATKS